MSAGQFLTGVAIILLAAAIWDDLRREGRVTPARKTYLLVASLFGLASAVLAVLS